MSCIHDLVKISKGMTGKMTGMLGISTSCHHNPRCQAKMTNKALICSHCYADNTGKCYPSAEQMWKHNGELLSNKLLDPGIDVEPIPAGTKYFRFESFGDLLNATHFKNYIGIAKWYPNVKFTLWTKNTDYVIQALKDGCTIPDNFTLMLSSPRLNHELVLTDFTKLHPELERAANEHRLKAFTVFSADVANRLSKQFNCEFINCGARDCMTCLKCYSQGSQMYIREVLKNEAHTYLSAEAIRSGSYQNDAALLDKYL